MNKKGINLIVLTVTIIVMIILAGVVIVTLNGNNNPIQKANIVTSESDLIAFSEELNSMLADKKAEDKTLNFKNLIVLDRDEVMEYIPSIKQYKKYYDKIVIISSEVYYIEDETEYGVESGKIKSKLKDLEIGIIRREDIPYVKEHKVLIDKVKEYEKDVLAGTETGYVGKALETPAHPDSVATNGRSYGKGWYLLEVSDLEVLGIFAHEYGSFIVNYEEGKVINVNGKSIDGKTIYSYNL